MMLSPKLSRAGFSLLLSWTIHGPAVLLSALYPGYDEQSAGRALMVTFGRGRLEGRARAEGSAARRVATERFWNSILERVNGIADVLEKCLME
jgi:hypothetical protein